MSHSDNSTILKSSSNCFLDNCICPVSKIFSRTTVLLENSRPVQYGTELWPVKPNLWNTEHTTSQNEEKKRITETLHIYLSSFFKLNNCRLYL